VGGGVIGLSIAWYLGRAGLSVRVLERDRIGSHASGAAAGMLAPLAETEAGQSPSSSTGLGVQAPLFTFGKASLDLYQAFLEQLHFDSEIEVLLEGPGLLRLAFNGEQADHLQDLVKTAAGIELNAEWVDEEQLRELQPKVSDQVVGAILSPHEKHVNPRRLVQALCRACQRQNVSFMEGIHAERASKQLGGTHKTIYAAGAWTGELLAELGQTLPVHPVKGQVVHLLQPAHDLRYTLFGYDGYLVPREDGNVLVGATSENAGFDERITDAGMESLMATAEQLFPEAKNFNFVEAWASLRPGTPDDLPILGRLPMENAFVATGHYRNGILQTPITAKLMAELIITDKEPDELAPFSPSRFKQASLK
jgi:glycine oxidase